MRPSEIRYTQSSIKSTFKDGTHIKQTLANLCNGVCNITDIPPLRIFTYGSLWWSLDNRRLWVFKQLEGKIGCCIQIPVTVAKPSIEEAKKMTTKTLGKSVKIRRANLVPNKVSTYDKENCEMSLNPQKLPRKKRIHRVVGTKARNIYVAKKRITYENKFVPRTNVAGEPLFRKGDIHKEESKTGFSLLTTNKAVEPQKSRFRSDKARHAIFAKKKVPKLNPFVPSRQVVCGPNDGKVDMHKAGSVKGLSRLTTGKTIQKRRPRVVSTKARNATDVRRKVRSQKPSVKTSDGFMLNGDKSRAFKTKTVSKNSASNMLTKITKKCKTQTATATQHNIIGRDSLKSSRTHKVIVWKTRTVTRQMDVNTNTLANRLKKGSNLSHNIHNIGTTQPLSALIGSSLRLQNIKTSSLKVRASGQHCPVYNRKNRTSDKSTSQHVGIKTLSPKTFAMKARVLAFPKHKHGVSRMGIKPKRSSVPKPKEDIQPLSVPKHKGRPEGKVHAETTQSNLKHTERSRPVSKDQRGLIKTKHGMGANPSRNAPNRRPTQTRVEGPKQGNTQKELVVLHRTKDQKSFVNAPNSRPTHKRMEWPRQGNAQNELVITQRTKNSSGNAPNRRAMQKRPERPNLVDNAQKRQPVPRLTEGVRRTASGRNGLPIPVHSDGLKHMTSARNVLPIRRTEYNVQKGSIKHTEGPKHRSSDTVQKKQSVSNDKVTKNSAAATGHHSPAKNKVKAVHPRNPSQTPKQIKHTNNSKSQDGAKNTKRSLSGHKLGTGSSSNCVSHGASGQGNQGGTKPKPKRPPSSRPAKPGQARRK